MNKAFYWVIATAVIAVAILGYAGSRSSSTQTPTTDTTVDKQEADSQNAPNANPIITFDGEKFTPSTITITSGQTVTFTNNSNDLVWIASDPHPTHTGLPGFDSLKGLSNGQSYGFTFVKTGTFGYHNHLNSALQGKVVVQ